MNEMVIKTCRKEGRTAINDKKKFQSGIPDCSGKKEWLKNVWLQSTSTINGTINKAPGWGDLKNRIIGAKSR